MWAFPRETSAKEQMRKLYNDLQSGEKLDAVDYASELKNRFSAEKMYKKFADLVYEHSPSQTIVNDIDEIEKLFAEAL